MRAFCRQIAGLKSDERLAGGKLLNDRVEVLHRLLSGQRTRQRDEPGRQQRDAQVVGAIGFSHVFPPEDMEQKILERTPVILNHFPESWLGLSRPNKCSSLARADVHVMF